MGTDTDKAILNEKTKAVSNLPTGGRGVVRLLRGGREFSTRRPCRPNPLGFSVVRLLERRDNTLKIQGVDVLDGMPLLDIKPYVPDFDVRTGVQIG